MYLEDMSKPGYFTVRMKCDDCGEEYNAKVRTVWKQESIVGHHQCRRCSSRRAGKKTASHGDFSNLVFGDEYKSRPDLWKKISVTKSGTQFSESHKKALRKRKSKTDKIIEAANRPEERERRRKRAIELMHRPGKRRGRAGFADFKCGWVDTTKTDSSIWYRSGLEKYFVEQISKMVIVVSVESAECLELEYFMNGRRHLYLPDFKIFYTDRPPQIVEVKGSFFLNDPRQEHKTEALKSFCNARGFSWVVLTEKEMDQWLDKLKNGPQPQTPSHGTLSATTITIS